MESQWKNCPQAAVTSRLWDAREWYGQVLTELHFCDDVDVK